MRQQRSGAADQRQQFCAGVGPIQRCRRKPGAEFGGRADRQTSSADAKRIRELERELARKDKALAETAALLVLQKKFQAFMGGGDDDTEPRSGR